MRTLEEMLKLWYVSDRDKYNIVSDSDRNNNDSYGERVGDNDGENDSEKDNDGKRERERER